MKHETQKQGGEATFSRMFDATVGRVWHAWMDARELTKWWGPQGVIIRDCSIEPRVGGKLALVMEASEAMGPFKGTRWPMEATITELEVNTRLAFNAKGWTEGHEDTTFIHQTTEMMLSDKGRKTAMIVKVHLLSTGPDAAMARQGLEMGFNQQFDKLAAFLSQT